MEFNIYRMANMKVPGEVYNFQACFEARDKHFDCMDSLKDNKGEENHYRCSQTLEIWRNGCNVGLFKAQMVNRELEMKNKGLYTKEQLKDYNRRKNDVSSHQERYNVFSIGKI